jgi:predicted ester cyclase
MSTEENKAFIRRYLEAINGKPKPPAILDLFIGEQPLKDHIASTEAAFPLYTISPEEIVGEGDLVCVRGMVHAVNLGSLMGMPPTGKEVNFSIFMTYKVAGGKIVDHWMLTDNLTMMQQLGVIPAMQG